MGQDLRMTLLGLARMNFLLAFCINRDAYCLVMYMCCRYLGRDYAGMTGVMLRSDTTSPTC